jgi:hypothetical protein
MRDNHFRYPLTSDEDKRSFEVTQVITEANSCEDELEDNVEDDEIPNPSLRV